MACPATDRGIRVATGAAIYYSRPGLMSFCAVSERWAYAIGRSHHDRLGRTDVRRGLLDRSGGIVLTMSLCLASGTFVICSNRTKNITTKLAHTCHCTRMHRSPAPSRPSVRRWPCPSWADFTTNTYDCEFTTGTGRVKPRQPGYVTGQQPGPPIRAEKNAEWMELPSSWLASIRDHFHDVRR
jgi:hypothetical protein